MTDQRSEQRRRLAADRPDDRAPVGRDGRLGAPPAGPPEATSEPPARTIQVREQTVEAQDEMVEESPAPLALVDDNPETLVDERRTEAHPHQFGRPGRPLRRNSPFLFGFFGALGVLLAYSLVQAVASVGSVLVLIVVALFLAVGLNPLVEALIRRGLRRGFAVAAVFLLTVLAFVGFGVAIVPPLVTETQEFVTNLPDKLGALLESERIRELNERYRIIDNAQSYVSSGNLGSQAFGGLLGFGRAVVGTVFNVLVVLILTLYFLASLPSIKRTVYALMPASRRERVSLLGDEVLLRIGGYVSGQFTVGLIAAVAAYIFLLIMSMPYPLALAIFTGFMSLVPMVGATIAMVVVTIVGLFVSLPVGISMAVYYTLYQQVENYLIYPRVMRRAVELPATLTVIAALVGGALLGVVGALLAIPLAAGGLLLAREVLIPRMNRL